ncbi:hypothetical protein [Alcaligenes phenolicus]|uniref:hypothetical protein n=1 Tax=Alcaligenes phenolicus TaxID=232846 RepID=UPI002C15A535|nr:hypothetical protein [Alcaligenes phenolicus]HRO20800.1 hypothetical protein [Alcaligenes phenolicus]HRP13632.1 hypothetical protein [Alcaligenes phenolicus]
MESVRKAEKQRDGADMVSDDAVDSVAVPEPLNASAGNMMSGVWSELVSIQKTLGGMEQKQITLAERLERVETKTTKVSDKISRVAWSISGALLLVSLVFGVTRFVPFKIVMADDDKDASGVSAPADLPSDAKK